MLGWGEGMVGTVAILPILAMGKDSAKAIVGGVRMQSYGEVKDGETTDRWGGEMPLNNNNNKKSRCQRQSGVHSKQPSLWSWCRGTAS